MYEILTQCFEDYGYRVKAKGGRRIMVETDDVYDAREVANLIADHDEHILDVREVDLGIAAEEELANAMMEDIYAPTREINPVVRRGNNGDFYLKRGYYVNRREERPEFKHLAGKFVGWVDNLNKNKCVMKIEGDVRTRLA